MDKFEQNTFGVGVDGNRGADTSSPASGSAAARDTTGNGYKLVLFRGDYMFHLYKDNILRAEESRRRKERFRRTDQFIQKNLD